jgi:hypothetical protein
MALRFLGINPDTPQGGSPTVWEDTETGDVVIQSYRADEATLAECRKTGEIPDHETVVRLPRVMVQFIPTDERWDGVADPQGA